MNRHQARKELILGISWGVGILALALGAMLTRKAGYVDGDTVTRIVIGINGLMIAWYGNRIPKTFVASASLRELQRVAGWSQVLSGLTYAGLWAFAPIPVAITAGMAVVIAGIVVTFGYALMLRAKAKTTP